MYCRKFEPIEDHGYSTIEYSVANKEHLPVAECEADITVNLDGPVWHHDSNTMLMIKTCM